jgi:hypothetical protein
MPSLPQLTFKLVLRGVVVAILPWLPAYLFERLDFWFGVSLGGPWYGYLTGWRLEADVVSFALGGIALAYLLRPRWALLQVLFASVVIWVLFYAACQTFRSPNGLLHSECYQTGPDGLAGIRLSLMMFSYGAIAPVAKAAEKRGLLNPRIRLPFALFAGYVVTAVMVWFPLAAWFSGVTQLPPFPIFQGAIVAGVPLMVTGMLAAKIGRSVKLALASGVVSFLTIVATFWTLLCPGCDRSLLAIFSPVWILLALLGGFLELGYPGKLPWKGLWSGRVSVEGVRRVATAMVIVVCLWSPIAYSFWVPSVLYASSISPSPGNLTMGLPSFPYVAGFYNSTQYRICCLEIGVSFAKANPALLAPNNFLMAGMGVQSPNCCIDGWDFGWRADAFLLPDSSILVSGSAWGTCDSNANCGGIFWQYLRYHAQVILHPANLSTPIFLRMMWEPSPNSPLGYQANWYYNTTGVSWTKFGSFIPDWREAPYFDIGSIGTGYGNLPQRYAYFYQFGVASKFPVSGWSVLLMYPSFQLLGSWRRMEHATVIQGDFSYWKGSYRWGGTPYPGVTAEANALNPSFGTDMAEFSYTGGMLKNNTPLW